MSNTVPEGWAAHELGDLAQKIEGGGTPSRSEPKYWNGDIPWATVKDLRGVSLGTTEEFITSQGLENSSSKLVPAKTMIIASRMAVGKAVHFNQSVAINQDLKAFYPKKSVSWSFLLQWYLSKNEQITSLATGSTVKGIRLDDLKLLPISLPPLPEQQKIDTILSSIDNVIETTRAQIDKLKALKTGMAHEFLTKGIGHTEFKDAPFGRIPVGWDVARLGDITVEHKQGYYSKQKYSKRGTYVVRITDMSNPKISFVDMPKMEIPEGDIEAYKLNNGDFLFARSGAIGRYGIYESDNVAVFASYLIRFRFNLEICTNHFIGYCYESEFCQGQISAITQGSSNININAQNIKDILVPLPPLPEQKQIASRIRAIDKRVGLLNARYKQLTNLKAALMQDLLTGKVRVKIDEKEKEPAVA
jgi:type I restriction enzyme S subunit